MKLKKIVSQSILLLLVSTVLTYSCSSSNPLVSIQTDKGEIIVELFDKKAPITATNFLKLVDAKIYDNSTFYRVVREDNQPDNDRLKSLDVKLQVIQGGLRNKKDSRVVTIDHESTKQTGILHKAGVISMARLDVGSASSEFFICVTDQPGLDHGKSNQARNLDGEGYAAFGKVVEGMDVVKQIQMAKDENQYVTEPIKIQSITRIK